MNETYQKWMLRDDVVSPVCVNKGWRRPIGGLMLIGHFPQKSPIISGFFAMTCNLTHPIGLHYPVWGGYGQ